MAVTQHSNLTCPGRSIGSLVQIPLTVRGGGICTDQRGADAYSIGIKEFRSAWRSSVVRTAQLWSRVSCAEVTAVFVADSAYTGAFVS